MKRITLLLLCVALALGSASTSYSSSVHEINGNDKLLSLTNSNAPLNFAAIKKKSVSFDGLSSMTALNVEVTSPFTSYAYNFKWTPPWSSQPKWNNRPPKDDGDAPRNSIPEPGTILLLGSGLIGLACISRKRMKI